MAEAAVFDGWAVLELMGHRRLGGYVSEATVAGAGFLRIDVPSQCPGVAATYCDVHGDCSCPRREGFGRTGDGEGCPLHASDSPCSDAPIASQFYSPSSVYCLTPVTEEMARAVAGRNQPQPVQRWELPRAVDHEVTVSTCDDCDERPCICDEVELDDYPAGDRAE